MMARNWLDDLTLTTVVVHTVGGGSSFKGNRRAVYQDGIVLSDASLLEPEGVTLIDGDLFIPREMVLGIQIIGGNGSA